MIVWEGDTTLAGRMSHYRGVRGLEEHVGRMDVRKVKADTGRCTDGVGVGKAARTKFNSTYWSCDLRGFILLRLHLCTRGDNSVTGVVGSSS